MSSVVKLSFVVLLVTACSGEPAGGGTSSCTGEYAELMGAYCDLIERCPNVLPVATAFRDRAECARFLCFGTTCRLTSTKVGRTRSYSITPLKPVVSSPARVQACVAWLEGASCGLLDKGLSLSTGGSSGTSSAESDPGLAGSPCEDVFTLPEPSDANRAQAGEPCGQKTCARGLVCVPGAVDVDAGVSRCAVCRPLPGENEPCVQGACAAGLYCRSGGMGMPTCASKALDGAPCQDGQACQSGFCHPTSKICDPGGRLGGACKATVDCRDGFCNAAMRCERPRENGGACTADEQCASLRCDEPSGRCGKPDGESCNADAECAGFCDSATRKCLPALALGTVCGRSPQCTSRQCGPSGRCESRCYSDGDCAEGMFCARGNDQCVAKQADGSPCENDGHCQSGFCPPTLEKCAPRPTVGSPCRGYGDCGTVGYCASGACAPYKRPGEACTQIDSCIVPYLCVKGSCTPMNTSCEPAHAGQLCAFALVCDSASYCDVTAPVTCKARVGAGAACSSDQQCAQELFCDAMKGACAPRLGAAAPCDRNDQCAAGLFCVAEGSGATRACAPGPAGQPCDPDGYDAPRCPAGYFCEQDACRALLGAGERCSGDHCADGLACVSGQCAAKGTLDQPCGSFEPCADAFYCDRDTWRCKPDVQEGGACTTSSSEDPCSAGLRCAWNGTASTCVRLKDTGAPCASAEECASKACYSAYGCLAAAACVP